MATVKVRIAVAVDPEGKWNAVGYCEWNSDETISEALSEVFDRAQVYWVTAELPVPEPTDVAGEVEK